MGAGVNYTVDLNTRVSNLEQAVFGGGSPQSVGTTTPVGGTLETESADGAIGIVSGVAVITKTSAAALTLAVPSAQDNGKTLRIISSTAFAHTVTTPANGIDGSQSVATFGGNVGDMLTLEALNGVWYARDVKNVAFVV